MLYKAVERLQNEFKGGRNELAKRLGVSKKYLDAVMRPANETSHDERHPPMPTDTVAPLTREARVEAAERVRDILRLYATQF